IVVACALLAAQAASTATQSSIEVLGTTSTADPGTSNCRALGANLVRCETTGFGTGFSGSLEGSSSTDDLTLIDCKPGRYHGEGTETFTGSVAGLGAGTLTWRLHFSGGVTPDCSDLTSFEGTGVLVHGTGELASLNGTLSFEGSSYSGSLH